MCQPASVRPYARFAAQALSHRKSASSGPNSHREWGPAPNAGGGAHDSHGLPFAERPAVQSDAVKKRHGGSPDIQTDGRMLRTAIGCRQRYFAKDFPSITFQSQILAGSTEDVKHLINIGRK